MANSSPNYTAVVLLDTTGAPYKAGGGTGGTSSTDNAAFTAGSGSGTPAMGIYEASPSTISDGNAAVVAIDANRNVKVAVQGTVAVSNAGLTELAAAINSSKVDINIASDAVGIGGGTQYTEDAAAAADPVGNALIMVRDDVLSGQTTTDGDNVAARGTDKGELYVKHVDAIPVTDNSGSLTVDAPVGTPAFVRLSDGSSAITTLPVSLASVPSHAVTNAGTFAVQPAGSVADDGTTPPNPVMVGGSVKFFDGTSPSDVSTEDDVARAILDNNRRQYVNTTHPGFWSYHLDTSTAQTDTEVKAAPGANICNFITDIVFGSGAATAINLFFEESSTKILGPYYLEATAGRGMALHFVTPKRVTANTAFTLTTSASIAHTVEVLGYTADVA